MKRDKGTTKETTMDEDISRETNIQKTPQDISMSNDAASVKDLKDTSAVTGKDASERSRDMASAQRTKTDVKRSIPVLCGLNVVMKRLEQCLGTAQVPTHSDELLAYAYPSPEEAVRSDPRRPMVVFVCTEDLGSTLLYDPIVLLAAMKGIPLCPLPKGSEARLAQALGVRHVSAFAFTFEVCHVPKIVCTW